MFKSCDFIPSRGFEVQPSDLDLSNLLNILKDDIVDYVTESETESDDNSEQNKLTMNATAHGLKSPHIS